MRTVAEYVAKVVEYKRKTERESNLALKKRYADLSASYQIMADERRRMIEAGQKPNHEGAGNPVGRARERLSRVDKESWYREQAKQALERVEKARDPQAMESWRLVAQNYEELAAYEQRKKQHERYSPRSN